MSETRINILHAIRQGKVGGGETHVLDLVRTLNPSVFRSVILSFTDGPMVKKLREEGHEVYIVSTERPFNVVVWDQVKAIVKKEQIHLIHAHGTRACSNTFSSAKVLKIPLVYTVHGWSFHPDQKRLVKTIRSLSERFLVKMADLTICVSQSNLEEGRRLFPMPKAKVILNGINRKKFDPQQDYKDIRAEFGISKDDLLVGYIARITEQKSPLAMIHAVAHNQQDQHIKYLIVGDGNLKTEMVTLAENLGVSQQIIFVDFRDDIPDILSSVDIFCLPSLWEGLPIALLEAMAMKKAIIASNIDGIRDVIEPMVNGILISPGNAEELSHAIKQLSNDAQLLSRLGEGAGKKVSEDFNLQEMTGKIESVYNELV